MENIDIAIIGSGMGGALSALVIPIDKRVVIFEKDSNLGGCAGTFKRYGNYFNVGATTLVGYEPNHPLQNILSQRGVSLDIKASPVAFRVIQNGKILDRHQNFSKFLKNLNSVFPHKNNYKFWKKIKDIDTEFWKLKSVYFAKYSLKRYFKTILFAIKLFKIFGFDLLRSSENYIKKTLPQITNEYQDFLDAGLLITVQSTSKNLPLLSMALGLAYPFHPTYYANKGMGQVFETMLEKIEVRKKEEITSITKNKDGYILQSKKSNYFAKQIILNTTLFDSEKLFNEPNIKKFYSKFLPSDQSAFVVYLSLKTKETFQSHYQIILNKQIPNALSKSFFISIGHEEDEKLGKNGLRSITISTHTKVSFWKSLSTKEYEKAKDETQTYIVEQFLTNFDTISKEEIIHQFSGTPKTFGHYIARTNCGGNPIGFHNIHKLGSCTTPFKGLFHIGDTVFAGQGWPGVALGVQVLKKELDAKC